MQLLDIVPAFRLSPQTFIKKKVKILPQFLFSNGLSRTNCLIVENIYFHSKVFSFQNTGKYK